MTKSDESVKYYTKLLRKQLNSFGINHEVAKKVAQNVKNKWYRCVRIGLMKAIKKPFYF